MADFASMAPRAVAPDPTAFFYRREALAYVERTVGASMAHLYAPFLAELEPGARILDVGCGSGRDVRAFRARGFEAFGLEPSPQLAQHAAAHAGDFIEIGSAETYASFEPFDGIWACASLLHVPRAKLGATIWNLRRCLAPAGMFFACVQQGAGDRTAPDGRAFADYEADTLAAPFRAAGFAVMRTWQTQDALRPDGPTWVNLLARNLPL